MPVAKMKPKTLKRYLKKLGFEVEERDGKVYATIRVRLDHLDIRRKTSVFQDGSVDEYLEVSPTRLILSSPGIAYFYEPNTEIYLEDKRDGKKPNAFCDRCPMKLKCSIKREYCDCFVYEYYGGVTATSDAPMFVPRIHHTHVGSVCTVCKKPTEVCVVIPHVCLDCLGMVYETFKSVVRKK